MHDMQFRLYSRTMKIDIDLCNAISSLNDRDCLCEIPTHNNRQAIEKFITLADIAQSCIDNCEIILVLYKDLILNNHDRTADESYQIELQKNITRERICINNRYLETRIRYSFVR